MPREATKPDDATRAVGLAIAVFGPLGVAGLLVGFRDDITNTNIALVLVLVVVCGAAVGTRWTGIITAVMATLTYDFFFTKPYQSLTIDSADDVETTILLLAISLLVSAIVAYARRRRLSADVRGDEISRIHRVAELVASGASSDVVIDSVRKELIDLLGLHDCRFETLPFTTEKPRLHRNGSMEGDHRRFVGGEYAFPPGGADIAVLARGEIRGRLVLDPDPDVGVSLEQRAVAIALSDQLGAALASEPRNS